MATAVETGDRPAAHGDDMRGFVVLPGRWIVESAAARGRGQSDGAAPDTHRSAGRWGRPAHARPGSRRTRWTRRANPATGPEAERARTTRRLPWRAPIASLDYLLTSHVWRQDHDGFSHQDPGFVDHILNESPEAVRGYFPPDANTLISVADHALRSRDYVNVIVAGKQPCFDRLPMDQAKVHCARGAGIWDWAGTEDGTREPDAVLACAGDVPAQEVLAAAQLLCRHLPELAVRVVNVVDIARLLPGEEHPHGMSDFEYDGLFTADKPVIFAYHGYPWLIHRLTART